MTSTKMAVLLAALWLAAATPLAKQGSECAAPLNEAGIKDAIAAGVPTAGLRRLITSCGLDLGLPDAASLEARLRQIGVPAGALSALSPPTDAMAGRRWISPLDRREMVFVPGGSFRMGTPIGEPARDSDEDAHQVILRAGFWADVDEVTYEAYQRFVLSRPEWQKGNVRSEFQNGTYLNDWDGTRFPAGLDKAPVVWVSWHAARAYAAWAGKRLPTEAEWERAARADTSSRYWWGDNFEARRVASDQKPATPDQMSGRTNPFGLRDTLGSVWEWTSSLYRPYPYVENDGREDPRSTAPRVMRGGSRANGESFVRVGNRNMEEATGANDLLGFRCIR